MFNNSTHDIFWDAFGNLVKIKSLAEDKYPAAWCNILFGRKMIITNYKYYFLIHYKISQHIRLQPSNYKGSVTSQESSRIKAIERIKRRAGSRAGMASIAARSNIVIFLKGVLVIL